MWEVRWPCALAAALLACACGDDAAKKADAAPPEGDASVVADAGGLDARADAAESPTDAAEPDGASLPSSGEVLWEWEVALDGLAAGVIVTSTDQTVVALRHNLPLEVAGETVMGRGSITLVWLDESGTPYRARSLSQNDTVLSSALMAATGDGGVALAGEVFSGDVVNVGGEDLVVGAEATTFVAVLDADGEHVWSTTLEATGGWASAQGLAVSAGGDIAVSGFFKGTIDFGGFSVTASEPERSAYIAVLEDATHARWLEAYLGEATSPALAAVAYAGERLFAAGYLNGDATAGSVDITLQHPGTPDGGVPLSDGVLLELQAAGDVKWGRAFGSDAHDFPNRLAASATRVATSAMSPGTLTFGPDTLNGSPEAHLGYVAVTDLDGTPLWARGVRADGGIAAGGVVVDAEGHVTTSISFEGELVREGITLASAAEPRAMVLAYDADGEPRHARELPGAAGSVELALAPNGDVVAVRDSFERAVVTRLSR